MNNTVKRILSFVCAAVLLFSLLPVMDIPVEAKAATDGLNLSQMQIVLPSGATAVEQTAASELQYYIQKITGVNPVIRTEGQQSGNCVYIGATKAASQKGITYPTSGDENGEAWAIRVVGSDLFLCGAPTRGPLYAVYHLLEDVLGVRWWSIWEEDVPEGDAIVPADYADSGVPAMEYREVFIGAETTVDYAFYARNRMNGSHTNIPTSYGGEEAYGLPSHTHTFDRYFPASFDHTNPWLSYISAGGDFSTNPEWYSMNSSGNRVSNAQLCLTNADLKAEFASRLVKTIEYCYAEADKSGTARPNYFAIVPNDNTNFCQCSSCQSIINTYSESDYVLGFVNEMAAAVKAAGYTDAVVEMLVYWIYVDAPVKEKPADNVQIRFADNYTDLLHGLDHANNAESMSNLQAWKNISSNNFYYWQYVVHYNANGVVPSMFHYGDDFVKLQEMGVNGWFAEQEQSINVDFWDMKQWLIAKLMENPVSGDEYTALMDEFIYGYYGEEAGKHIRDYLYYMNAKAEATNLNQNFGTSIIGAEWLTIQDILKGNDYFEKAIAAANGDATLLRRICAARNGLDRVIYENFPKWQSAAASAGLTLPFTHREVGERIYESMTALVAMRGSYDPDYTKFYNSYKNKYSDDQPALPSDFSSAAREHVLDYTADDFRAVNSYNSIVSDSESLTGKAFKCDTSGLSTLNSTYREMMKNINIKIYDPEGTTNNGIRTIGAISAKNLTRNSGYKLYSFSYTVPTLSVDPSGYVYLFDDWGLQIPDMKQDLSMLAGKTVTIYLSIKANGSLSSSTYFKGQYYIDRVIILPTPNQMNHSYVTTPSTYGDSCRSVCEACGDVILSEHAWNLGEIIKEPTYTEEGEKLLTCTTCGTTKTETISVLEKPDNPIDDIPAGHLISVRDYSAFATASAEGTTYVDDPEAYGGKAVCYSKAVLTSHPGISINRYDAASGLGDGHASLRIGTLSYSELKINQGYQVYQFSYYVPKETTAGNVLYIMSNWQLNSSKFCADFAPYAGQTVNVYFSMKVTGPDANGHYAVSVDRVALATSCEDYANADGTACNLCGKSLLVDMPIVFKAEDLKLPYAPTDSVVEDSDSQYGKAAMLSYTKRAATGDGGLMSAMIRGSGLSISLYTSGTNNARIGGIYGEQLQANSGKGYQNYTFRSATPIVNSGDTFMYMFDCWGLQVRFTEKQLKTLLGKTLDITVSMKVTGDVTSTSNPPAYYIESISFAIAEPDVIDLIPESHLASVRDYSYFATEAGKTEYVNDLDAFGGKAVCYSKATLDNSIFVSINRYDAASGLSDAQLRIGTMMRDDLLINQGYQTYRFSYYVPEGTTEGNVFYIMNNWQLNSSQFCKDFAAYAGKTVDVYLSMKVTGPDDSGYYSIYVDRVALATSCEDTRVNGVCTVCGSTDELIAQIPDGHLESIRDSSCFNTDANEGTTFVSDSDAFGGKAVCFSKAKLTSDPKISINRYDAASGLGDGHASLKIGELGLNQLRINSGYHIYKFIYNVPVETTAGNVLYIMSNWQLNTASFCADFAAFAGKTVEVYISMKVTGPDTNGYYSVYVDRVALASTCDTEGTVCSGCGKLLVDSFSASFYADDFTLPYSHVDSVVTDSDSAYGKAVKLSYADRAVTGDEGLVNAMTFGSAESLELRNNSEVLLGKKSFAVLYNNAQKGTYVTYKYENVDLTDANFIFLFSCWGFQIKLDEYKDQLSGLPVNVYVSMKIVGNIDEEPTYYIDKVEITTENYAVDENVQAPIDFTLTTEDFNLPYSSYDSIVTDADSAYGSAAKLSYLDRAGDAGLQNSLLRSEGAVIKVYSYGPSTQTYVELGGLEAERLQYHANVGGYTVYTLRNVKIVPKEDEFFLYMFECWGFQAKLTNGQRALLLSRNVDVSISIKVTGNISDPSDPPAYYIDAIRITDPSDAACIHDYELRYLNESMHSGACFLCGETMTGAHSWNEGVVTVEPTFTTEGVKTYACLDCGGTKTEAVDKLSTPANSWNLVLGDNIGIQFLLNVEYEELSTATVDVSVNGETVTYNTADLLTNADGLPILMVKLAAAQMSDVVTITVHTAAGDISKTYSVREYADYILSGDYDDVTKNLVKNMLSYGAASQTYFGYNTQNLANAGITVDAAAVPAEETAVTISGSISGIAFYGASLVHKDKIAVRFYFTGDLSAVDLSGYTTGLKNDMQYIEISNINPYELDENVTVTLTVNGQTLTVGYSPMAYITRMYNKEDASENTKALVQALYGYYVAAEAYTAAQ